MSAKGWIVNDDVIAFDKPLFLFDGLVLGGSIA